MNSRLLAVRFLGERKSRTMFSIGAIAIGVAVLMSQIILGSGQNYLRVWRPESYGPGNITVFTNGKGSLRNLAAVRAMPGVADAAGEINAYTYQTNVRTLADRFNGLLDYTGVDFRSDFVKKGYPLAAGRYPQGAREVVVSAKFAKGRGLGVGKNLLLPLPGGGENHRVVGLFDDKKVIDSPQPLLALMAYDSLANEFKKRDFDRFQVRAKAGRQREVVKLIREQLGPVVSIKLKPTGPVIQRKKGGAERFITGGAVLFVAGLLIYNSFLISVNQRRRQLGIIRAVGAGGKRIQRLVMKESLLLGTIASIAGIVAGVGIAASIIWLRRPLRGDTDVFALPLWGPPVAFLLGVGMTLASALPAARRTIKANPLDAIYPERRQIVGWLERRGHYAGAPLSALGLAGVFYLGLTGDSTPIGIPAGVVGIVFFLLGLVLVSPQLVRPLTTAAGRLANVLFGGLGRLSLYSAAKNPGRTGITISTFFIAVTVILGFLAINNTLESALGGRAFTGLGPDQIRVNGGLAGDARRRLSGIKGIKAMAPESDADLRLKHYDFNRLAADFVGQSPEVKARMVPPNLYLAGADANYLKIRQIKLESSRRLTKAMLKGGNLFLTRQTMRNYGFRVGEKLELVDYRLGADPYDLPVTVALFEQAKEEGPAIKLRIAGILASDGNFWTNGLASAKALDAASASDRKGRGGGWLIKVKDGAVKAKVVKAIERRFKDHPEVSITTSEGIMGYRPPEPPTGFSSVLGFVGLVMVIGVMSVANTQSANIIERQKELGLLRSVGLTNRKLKQMLILESSALGILGSLPGVLASALLSYIFIFGFRGQAQGAFDLPYRFPYVIAVAAVAATALAGLIAGLIAMRKVTSPTIVESLRYE